MDDNNNKDFKNEEDKEFFEQEFEKRETESQKENYKSNFGSNGGNTNYAQGWDKYVKSEARASAPKKGNGKMTIIVAVCVLLITVAFAIGCATVTFRTGGLVEEILNIMDQYYLYDYDEGEMLMGALTGLTGSLDPYTHVMNPQEYYELVHATDDAMYYGISYGQSGADIVIKRLLLDSPADCALSLDRKNVGLRKDDIILKVNDTVVKGYTISELQALISHTQSVAFTVLRDGEEIAFSSIMPSKLDSRYVEYFYEDSLGNIMTNMRYYVEINSTVYTDFPYIEGENGEGIVDFNDTSIYPHYDSYALSAVDNSAVGYIKLYEFSYTEQENTTNDITDFTEAMNVFRDSYNGAGILVLDLNDNPGGYNNYCRDVASFLIYNGTPNEKLEICSLRYKNSKYDEYTYTNSKYADYFDENATEPQIYVLTSDSSASASEMLTGAVLVYETGVQIGLQTYGKGISQSIIEIGEPVQIIYEGRPVTSHYAFYFTFARFYTPNIVGSNSIYVNYCNQSDDNGNGVIDETESKKGFKPLDENTFAKIKDQMNRVNDLLSIA